ncbi:MAG: hypothetical protein HDQ96_04615 [Lachnospiraceae bacterium]|nr:hypothetical protein [Lachnospiraceae bacterium]
MGKNKKTASHKKQHLIVKIQPGMLIVLNGNLRKKVRKEIDEVIKVTCKKIKDGNGMTEQQKETIKALASLVSARALLNYEFESSEEILFWSFANF